MWITWEKADWTMGEGSLHFALNNKDPGYNYIIRGWANGRYFAIYTGYNVSQGADGFISLTDGRLYRILMGEIGNGRSVQVKTGSVRYVGTWGQGATHPIFQDDGPTLTFTIPDKPQFHPTISTMTCTSVTPQLNTSQFIGNYSQLRVQVSASACVGTSITQTAISVDGAVYYGNDITTVHPLSPGKHTVTVTVTDGRGFTSSKTQTITAAEYKPVSITKLTARRCDAKGNLNTNGTYIRVDYDISVDPSIKGNAVTGIWIGMNVDGAGKESQKIPITTNPGTYITGDILPTGSTAEINLHVYDLLSDSMEYVRLGPVFKFISGNKRSIAFGKESKHNGTFEVGMPLEYRGKELIDLIYPVGSVIITTTRTNPGLTLGGAWVEFASGRTLIGTGSIDGHNFTMGETGGEVNHALTSSEMPSHYHDFAGGQSWGWGGGAAQNNVYADVQALSGSTPGNAIHTEMGIWCRTQAVGAGGAHNNLQPYIVVTFWHRIK